METKTDSLLEQIKALYPDGALSESEAQEAHENFVSFFTELIEADLENRKEGRFSVASFYNPDGTKKGTIHHD